MKRKGQSAYPAIERVKAWAHGLAAKLFLEDAPVPMAEVAMRGIRKSGLPQGKRNEYLKVIEKSGSTGQIKEVLVCFAPKEETQVNLAKAFTIRHEKTRESYLLKITSVETSMAGEGINARMEHYSRNAVLDAREILISGKLASEKAQFEMSAFICSEGSTQDARAVLVAGRITSYDADTMLRLKGKIAVAAAKA